MSPVLALLVSASVLTVFTNNNALALSNTKGSQALDTFPLIDGHNDLAFNLYMLRNDKINDLDLNRDLRNDTVFGRQQCSECHTDLVRLRRGKVGCQFWSAYITCDTEPELAIEETLNAIDVIKRTVNKYPDVLEFVTTADGILEAFREKRIASLIGVEGGHSINNNLAMLRIFYDLGVRYMTLTHACNLNWASSSTSDEQNGEKGEALTAFGEKVVLEMNRLGMMVDLSHTSHSTQLRALEVSKAPVIFSHSSVFALRNHARNVHDDVLRKLKENGGVVMINFYNDFVSDKNVTTIHDVVAHINYVADLIGFDNIGIGADYDGVSKMPTGLEDVSKYPDLFDLLHEKEAFKWSLENLEKLAGRNLYRVFKKVEQGKDELKNDQPCEFSMEEVKLKSGTGQVAQIIHGMCLIAFFTVLL